ncbi:MAG: hypothetical protein JW991_05755 [Candidatus Pacebacteria bacterium]|nr:hypothetical protein [Candidatus Paceibacterota bacterium]
MKKFYLKRRNFIFLIFLIFQALVFLNFAIGHFFVQPKDSFVFADSGQKPKLLWRRANFDGVHYLSIARNNYGLYQQAFFPLYPKLISCLGRWFGGEFLLAGWLISFFSLWLSLLIFYKLVRLDYKKTIARRAIVFLLLFPTSFYFTALYTEAFFLLLILLTFYWARTGRWGLAPLTAALASGTRLVGIFLVPALLSEIWLQQKKNQRSKIYLFLLAGWVVVVSSLGLVFYMLWLNRQFADPLLFVHVQPQFGAQRSGGKIIILYQVFWRYLKMIVTCQKNSPLYFTVWLELFSACLFLGLNILAYFKKMNPGYLVFAFLAFLTPTLTGTFSSLPRYVLVLFPGFIILAQIFEKKSFWVKVYFFLSLILFFVCQFFFSQGYWIS